MGLSLGAFFSNAQESIKHWNISVGIQNHSTLRPSAYKIKFYQFQGFGLNGTYMFTKNFGAMAGFNYGLLDFQGLGTDNQKLFRTNIQVAANLASLFKLEEKSDKLGLMFHAGIGSSHLKTAATEAYENDTKLFKHSDDMFNVCLGLTPSYKFNQTVSIFADYSLTANSKQNFTFDGSKRAADKTFNGGIGSLMIGLSLSF